MKCPEVQEHLSAWLDGETPEELHAAMAAHLARCPACQAELRALERLDAALGWLTAPAPLGLADKVRRRLQPQPSPPWYQSLALAACLVLGIFLGGALTGSFYQAPAPRNGNGADLASLEYLQDFPQGSLGTAVSYPVDEDNVS